MRQLYAYVAIEYSLKIEIKKNGCQNSLAGAMVWSMLTYRLNDFKVLSITRLVQSIKTILENESIIVDNLFLLISIISVNR